MLSPAILSQSDDLMSMRKEEGKHWSEPKPRFGLSRRSLTHAEGRLRAPGAGRDVAAASAASPATATADDERRAASGRRARGGAEERRRSLEGGGGGAEADGRQMLARKGEDDQQTDSAEEEKTERVAATFITFQSTAKQQG
jgi:hypothetical protein